MNGILTLMPLLIAGAIILIYRTKKTKQSTVSIQVNKRFHLGIIIAYISLLVVATVIAEMMEPNRAVSLSFEAASVESEEDIVYAISTGKEIDPSRVLVDRTHAIGDHLTIKTPEYGTEVYIKRKDVNDGKVEETIYAPIYLVNNYDFTKHITIIEPKWTNDSMVFQPQPFPVIEHVSFHDNDLLNQFSDNNFDNFMSYGASSSGLVVYLTVPKDIIIDATDEELVEYLD